jgi:hypothetical protein
MTFAAAFFASQNGRKNDWIVGRFVTVAAERML